jgi:hypothetical protein
MNIDLGAGWIFCRQILALRYDPADPSIVVAGARTSTVNIWIAVAVATTPSCVDVRDKA